MLYETYQLETNNLQQSKWWNHWRNGRLTLGERPAANQCPGLHLGDGQPWYFEQQAKHTHTDEYTNTWTREILVICTVTAIRIKKCTNCMKYPTGYAY